MQRISPRIRRRWRAVPLEALHEAAHAVVAHALGLDVIRMQVVAEDAIAREEDGRSARGLCQIAWVAPDDRIRLMATLWGAWVHERMQVGRPRGRQARDEARFWARVNFSGDRADIENLNPTWVEFLRSYRMARRIVREEIEEIIAWGDLLHQNGVLERPFTEA